MPAMPCRVQPFIPPHFSVPPVLCGPCFISSPVCTSQSLIYAHINFKSQSPHETQYAHFIFWDRVTSLNIILWFSMFISKFHNFIFYVTSPRSIIPLPIYTVTGSTSAVNNAATSIDVQVPAWDNIASLETHPGVVQLDHTVVLLLTAEKHPPTPRLPVAMLARTITNSRWGFLIHHRLGSICCGLFSWWWPLCRGDMGTPGILICLSKGLRMLNLKIKIIGYLVSFENWLIISWDLLTGSFMFWVFIFVNLYLHQSLCED